MRGHMSNTFDLTEEHLALLQRTYVGWCGDEYGAPEINPKRPYGNSSVEYDIAEILGWTVADDGLTDEQRERARRLHLETQDALQIVLSTRSFVPGRYVINDPYMRRSWHKVA